MTSGFLLDTNVLSELMRSQPAEPVLAWFAAKTQSAMFTSTINQAEILAGIALLPAGQRCTALASAAEQLFDVDFDGRCPGFDAAAARNYAVIVAARTRQGRPISTEDAQIAAITLAAGLTLLTRNIHDFEGIDGLALENPWLAGAAQ